MSHGRHSRPRARGGGLAGLLALALAGGALTVALHAPSSTLLRWCVVGGGAVGAVGLLLMARLQRESSRAVARTEERLRVLELRSRDEGQELHRRVLESVTREGELRFAVDVLSMEIARLRASLEVLVVPVEAAVASIAELAVAPAPYPASAEPASTYDLPLLAAAFAAPVPPVAPVAAEVAQTAAAATELYAVAEPPAGDLWRPPARPEPVPVVSEASPEQVRSWVVRELHVDAQAEPVAALTMRILDLRTPAEEADQPAAEEPEQAGSETSWSAFARPA